MHRATLLAAAFAMLAVPAIAADKPTDAAACETIEGFQAFVAQWNIDLQGALSAGKISAEVHDYIARRADEIAQAMSPKATAAERLDVCEALNVLLPR